MREGHVHSQRHYETDGRTDKRKDIFLFSNSQIEDMIDYIAIAVLKPYKLYRLYTLISFVHEAGETPEIIKARLEDGIN